MRLAPLLVAIALVSGCNNPVGGTGTANQKAATRATQAKTVSVTGAVTAPAGVIATGGGNVISTGGGNVISTGGGNFRVLSLEEAPLADTTVYLADGKGNKVPGVAEAKTDKHGKFTFSKVPKGNYQVVAKAMSATDQKEALLKSVVKVGTANTTTQVGASSTMVSTLMLDKVKGNIEAFDNTFFDKAVAGVASKLTPENLPDLTDPADVLGDTSAMVDLVPELKDMTAKIDAALAELDSALSDAQKDLEEAQKEASAALGLR